MMADEKPASTEVKIDLSDQGEIAADDAGATAMIHRLEESAKEQPNDDKTDDD